jgi:hypothetical protein
MSSGVEQSAQATLRIGDWIIQPLSGPMTRGEETVRLEARTLRLARSSASTICSARYGKA